MYNEGWYYINSNIHAPELLQTKYDYYDYKYPEKIDITKGRIGFAHNTDGHYKLMILGNSYVENVKEFLYTSFKDTQKYRIIDIGNFRMKPYEKIALAYKPDALLIIFHRTTPYEHMYNIPDTYTVKE